MKRTILAVAAAAVMNSCERSPESATHAESLPTPEPVVAAERAFAADAAELGFKGSFLKNSAPDAIVIAPDPVNAHQSLNALPDEDLTQPRPEFTWWPVFAGIAKSGDFGFTTGPYSFDGRRPGHYFTVWKLQEDGAWKWIFDAGNAADASAEPDQQTEPVFLATAASGEGSSEAAIAIVDALEDEMAAASATDLSAAYEGRIADVATIHSERHPPAKGASDHAAAIAARPDAITVAKLGAAASSAGDMVWTYGTADWTGDDGAAQRGFYARMWQKQPEGWRIVFDEMMRRAAPPPPPAE